MPNAIGRRHGLVLPVLFVLSVVLSIILKCQAFQNHRARHRSSHFNLPAAGSLSHSFHHNTALNVMTEPPQDLGSSSGYNNNNKKNPEFRHRRQQQQQQQRRPIIKNIRNKRQSKKEEVWSSGKWSRAEQVESQLLHALETVEMSIKAAGVNSGSIAYPLMFPGIRDCNAALAAFGDGEDLFRALRLYFKMKKAASLGKRYPPRTLNIVPAPTLVTYSTLMSRAVHLGKPLVALRLWTIMRSQTDFFSSVSSVPAMRRIIPDVKAANILMNCYAKLGNLEAAQDLMEQMLQGGEDVPCMTPNLVTYNTLMDACNKSNELDAALRVKEYIEHAGIRPDARTYTTLIATVARRASVASGANDPTLAFSFLQEMKVLRIRPNGMTYSALIDACGRCRRSDLALKALRLMLDQKAQEQETVREGRHTLSSEVGAWTAAINACGKAGRIDTAVKLFHSMTNFGVHPNKVTCGCLLDCLLKNGRVGESLSLLRYMKKNRIAPSEVMYTSLMTSAGRLAQLENERVDDRPPQVRSDSTDQMDVSEAKAVEVYAELMRSLMQTKSRRTFNGIETPVLLNRGQDDSTEVYKVSLVFQEMKAAGVEPDLGCYNALLRSCANAGDVRRAEDVMNQIKESDDMEPNTKTWREMIKAAGKAGRVDVALSTWKEAVEQIRLGDEKSAARGKIMDAESLGVLLTVLVGSAGDDSVDDHTVLGLRQLVFKIYEAVLSGSSFLGMDLVDRSKMLANPKLMLTFLHAMVSLEKSSRETSIVNLDPAILRKRAMTIIRLKCLGNGVPNTLWKNASFAAAYRTSRGWLHEAQQ
jgi:pentatricopeptide repeat protein